MNNINLEVVKPQFMSQIILALRGDKAIEQTVFGLRARFGVLNRSFNKADFYEICKSENIYVIKTNEWFNIGGIYMFCKEWRMVYINPRLSESSFLKVAYHELGHHFLHGRSDRKNFFREPQILNNYVREAQANYFSQLTLAEVRNV